MYAYVCICTFCIAYELCTIYNTCIHIEGGIKTFIRSSLWIPKQQTTPVITSPNSEHRPTPIASIPYKRASIFVTVLHLRGIGVFDVPGKGLSSFCREELRLGFKQFAARVLTVAHAKVSKN